MLTLLTLLSLAAITAGTLMYWKDSTINISKKLEFSKRVSIIIPTRNEENNLPILLKSLQNQNLQSCEVIVADDQSDDRTVEIANHSSAKVVHVKKTKDWKGKTFGCWEGAKAASGDWLVFMDADTQFADSKSLERVLSAYQEQDAEGMLSIQPYHDIQKPYENFSAVFNILVTAGMNIFSVFGKRADKPGGFGPFLLTDKESYFKTGGHKRVKESLIEGLAIGNNYQEKNFPVRLYSGRKTVLFRMYPKGFTQLLNGWTKHFATGSKNTQPEVMILISLWIMGGFLIPTLLLLVLFQSGVVWILTGLGCYLLYFLQFYIFSRRIGNFSVWAALFYPILILFFIGVFIRSWIATNVFKSVEWKGQKIDL